MHGELGGILFHLELLCVHKREVWSDNKNTLYLTA